jgi:hypothetical protein
LVHGGIEIINLKDFWCEEINDKKRLVFIRKENDSVDIYKSAAKLRQFENLLAKVHLIKLDACWILAYNKLSY